jgi:hypothetical protein
MPKMLSRDPLAAFPERIRQSTQNPNIVYVRTSGLYAVQGGAVRSMAVDTPLVALTAETGEIRVYRGKPLATRSLGTMPVTAVYSPQASSAIAVPTGRVFVRFVDAVEAITREKELLGAGYRIVETLSYAPNAAWLTCEGGTLAALRGLEKIEQLSGVENVEPQFVSQRQSLD